MADKAGSAKLEAFVKDLKRRRLTGSLETAKRTAVILRQLVADSRSPTSAEVLESVRATGERLTAACHTELTIGNIVRRVQHFVREEAAVLEGGERGEDRQGEALEQPGSARAGATRLPSLATLLEVNEAGMASGGVGGSGAGGAPGARRKGEAWKGRHAVLDAINELLEELDGIQQQICDQALEHVHSNEVILTFGYCRTVHFFLREAAKKRRFQVVVAESGPSYEGQRLARDLANDGIATTCITDAAVFAMMARANMVLIGAHAVLANGGMLGVSGSHMVALAAQRHAVPFVVLTGLHKLSPIFPHDPDVTLNELRSPSELLDFDAIADSLPPDGEGVGPDLHAVNPSLDYVPPQLISLFITDGGCFCASYVYRLQKELFGSDMAL